MGEGNQGRWFEWGAGEGYARGFFCEGRIFWGGDLGRGGSEGFEGLGLGLDLEKGGDGTGEAGFIQG